MCCAALRVALRPAPGPTYERVSAEGLGASP